MENVDNILENTNALLDANEDASIRLAEIKQQAVGEDLVDGDNIDLLIASVIANAKLAHVKTGKFMTDNRNMVGGVLGVALGVGLELLSPTGSKTSALVAGVAGAGALAFAAPMIKAVPQTTSVAAATGIMTSFVSMSAGRIAADYFPGNLDSED